MNDRGNRMTSPPPIREDPTGLIGQAVAMGAEFPGPAEDVLLSWILTLAPDLDPIVAAARVIEHYRIAAEPEPARELGRLARLLRETAACLPDRPQRKKRVRRDRTPNQ